MKKKVIKDKNYYMNQRYTLQVMQMKNGLYSLRYKELKLNGLAHESVEEGMKLLKEMLATYIDICLQEGTPIPEADPDFYETIPPTKKTTIRMPTELAISIKEKARKNDVSENQYIVYLLAINHALQPDAIKERVEQINEDIRTYSDNVIARLQSHMKKDTSR